jgi:maltose alpha-D-glucosyltransferase/alpha-amylase
MSDRPEATSFDSGPDWYKDAVIYELHVRAFSDSDADGVGDFKGLREKLDYLQDLGVTAIWLLPFYPSPLRDDGYDIADYVHVHETYGTLRDFKLFLKEAHRRGLRVVTELVVNHTSDQHPWFKRARRAAPDSRWRDFYVWSDTPEKYQEARVIFKDFEASNWTWDRKAGAYYWHRFYSHQPDLNYDNPEVHKSIMKVMDFWLDLGVDGLRLDAVPYLYQRQGTNCENLPETHEFLRGIRKWVDDNYDDRMLLAEANQWPEDSVAYFGDGDECHMAFHFPLMPRLFMAVQLEDRFPIIDILEQTPDIPSSAQWAIFLRNHDELTLEMVTDEERDYMVRAYAQDQQARINLGIRRRLAPLLGNNRRKIELMNGLLFSLPGTPVLYYGDEIGMGDNIYLGDRNGVRTPMQWSSDRNAGFSRANPQQLFLPVIIDPEYHFETVNVEAQQNNAHSLLWWTKRLIALRKRYRAFSRGDIRFLQPDNRKVLAFSRSFGDELVLVVCNLSRFTQYVELDLSAYNGMVPVELFGRTRFPPIGELPYFVILGPHSFYWFSLEQQRVDGEPVALSTVEEGIPALPASESWETLLQPRQRARLESYFLKFLPQQRWYSAKSREIRSISLRDDVPFRVDGETARWILLDVEYVDGDPETYVVPLIFAADDRAISIGRHTPHLVLVRTAGDASDHAGVVFDALRDSAFATSLVDAIQNRRHAKEGEGDIFGVPTDRFRSLRGPASDGLEPQFPRAEQSNSSVVFGDRLILKVFRRLDEGINPDLEISRFLTARRFPHVAPLAGALEYHNGRGEPGTLGLLHGYVPNHGDAWQFSLDYLGRFFEDVLALRDEERGVPWMPEDRHLLEYVGDDLPDEAKASIGTYLHAARLLGQRTAELHLVLASSEDNPVFAPEPLTRLKQRALYQSMRSSSRLSFQMLRKSARDLPDDLAEMALGVADREEDVLARFKRISAQKIEACLIRCHGDYHLGQVLNTGKDFVIIDFEGEPARPLTERRLKRSPLRDVAGMVRSFHYAGYAALLNRDMGGVRAEDQQVLEPWARYWSEWSTVAFLKGYLETAEGAVFLPSDQEDLALMLDAYRLDKAMYEIRYELDNRPEWLQIPLRGVLDIIDEDPLQS